MLIQGRSSKLFFHWGCIRKWKLVGFKVAFSYPASTQKALKWVFEINNIKPIAIAVGRNFTTSRNSIGEKIIAVLTPTMTVAYAYVSLFLLYRNVNQCLIFDNKSCNYTF